MQFETIYFVERKSKSNILCGDVLEWTISLTEQNVIKSKSDLEKENKDDDTYFLVRSMVITD